ncbi:phosphoglycerate kinase [Thermoproteota archaeon]
MRTIDKLDPNKLHGKRVLVRVDFNVPIQNGVITDDARITAALPTINYLLDHDVKIILASHLGRPKGKFVQEYSLAPVAKRLSEIIKQPVTMSNDCIGADVAKQVKALKNKDILLLENVRFYNEETENDPDFARKLAGLADYFVHDAFGVAHRAHASTEGIAKFIPPYAGFLLKREIDVLNSVLQNPKRPFIAIVGGAKISTKIGILKNLLNKVDTLIIGGGMTFAFLKAQDIEIGKSLCDSEQLEEAKLFLKKTKSSSVKVIFPVDQVVVTDAKTDTATSIVDITNIPKDKMGVDIGPKTIALLHDEIQNAGTVLWNGPMGIFEKEPFSKGTFAIAKCLAESNAFSIVCGGDSVAALTQAGYTNQIDHISTGGGASLKFLEGETLPAEAILEDESVYAR